MKVIVITGGSRGIGAAAGGKAVALPLDVGDAHSFGAFREAVVTALTTTWDATTLHGLVNNAGYDLFNPIATVTQDQFDGLMNVHLKGPFS